ncbi:MAG: hypothetical protein ACJA0Q_001551 [Saprospiraceae bacterium]|jgi:hypothetical protein
MENKGITTFMKRILFISLFIVPFLLGMALIFISKGIGSLPVLHEKGTTLLEGKEVMQHYQVSNFTANRFDGTLYTFSRKDSSIFLLCLFEEQKQSNWEEQLSYMSKIVDRYQNFKLLSVYENDPSLFNWAEDPVPFFNRHPAWGALWLEKDDFESLVTNLKLYRDSTTNTFPYVIIDKEKYIRTYCPIDDLKKSRDVPKLLKILNNQYVPKKIELTKKPT